ncbi:NUDIX hydrolase [Priestia taiwanensis]|uniref:7,8-dihydro-8-oxoguanine triphosphatase n=1 Tax=Priestia taiwanensis TaxID=1347902 RepID=A0A917AJ14_9BACI|nr:8-oxo-dGTP diphosphatase [Priestia taiwanensis]MBM7361651.1 8-oxo-dGTP diphosphatase [Priestia taiwanensis]GGE55841.1 7,8-dihydro-8-oxoguanine triphosphatase [Priestia taiwanensis]
MYAYTICFIKCGNKLLLLNRDKKPNMGLWNGVGGKIEAGERVEDSIKREVLEETSLVLEDVMYKGIVSWNVNNDYYGGMYLFFAELTEEQEVPSVTEEGILAWKEISWLLDPDNQGIVSNIREFLPNMLTDERIYEYQCTYTTKELVGVNIKEITAVYQ